MDLSVVTSTASVSREELGAAGALLDLGEHGAGGQEGLGHPGFGPRELDGDGFRGGRHGLAPPAARPGFPGARSGLGFDRDGSPRVKNTRGPPGLGREDGRGGEQEGDGEQQAFRSGLLDPRPPTSWRGP